MADTTQTPEAHEDIYELFRKVRSHPDFVFGTIFTREDFPNAEVPEDFPSNRAEDTLSERGYEYMGNVGVDMSEF